MSVLGLVLAFAVFYLLDGVVTPWLLYSERFAPFWLRRKVRSDSWLLAVRNSTGTFHCSRSWRHT